MKLVYFEWSSEAREVTSSVGNGVVVNMCCQFKRSGLIVY